MVEEDVDVGLGGAVQGMLLQSIIRTGLSVVITGVNVDADAVV